MTGRHERVAIALISIVLAGLLWVYVVGQKESEWTYTIPMSIELPSTEVVAHPRPDRVSVTLRGPHRLLHETDPNRLLVRLVLADAASGEYTRPLSPSMVFGLPTGIEIVRMEPSEVVVDIRPLVSRKFRVFPRLAIRGEPLGLGIAPSIAVNPSHVEVRGPNAAVKTIDRLWTDELLLDPEPGRRTTRLRIVTPEGVTAIPSAVQVEYEVVAVPPADTAAPL